MVPPLERLTSGVCGAPQWAGLSGGGGGWLRRHGAQYATSVRHWSLVHFVDKGYNTNYAASWFLVRSAPKVNVDTVHHAGHDRRRSVTVPNRA